MNENAARLGAALASISETAIVQILLILAGAWLLITLAQRLIPALAGRLSGRRRLQALALVPALRLLVIVAALLLVLQRIIEPTFENLVGLLGALGLALGFAAKDYASSLIAGIVVLYELPYRPGDWIKVDETYGEVRTIGMRTVEIVTPDDTVVHIPHLKLWENAIFNANDGSQNLQCVVDFYLHPRHDAAQVHHMLYDVALTSPLLQIDQPISVIVREKPFGTHYRLKAYPLDPRQQFAFGTDLTVRGKAALLGSGVELASFPTVAGSPS